MRDHKGFTLVELLIVIGVLGVVFSLVYIAIPRDRLLVNQAVERFERDIQRARFNAISHNTGLVFSISPDGSQYSAVPDSSIPGAQRAAFVVNFEGEGMSGVNVNVDETDSSACDGAPGPGSWWFDARGVGRQDGVKRLEFNYRNSTYTVALCVNSYGRVTR